MRSFLFALVVSSLAFVHQTCSAHPYLLPIRAEILNQQTILSNSPTVDRKLATALRSALRRIDTTSSTTTIPVAAKVLSSVASTLSRSSLSNQFGPLLDASKLSFLGSIQQAGLSASNRLAGTYPTRSRTAAETRLNTLFSQIESALANGNIVAATKLIGGAARTYGVANALVTKAENAPPPGNTVSAKVNGGAFRSAARSTEATYEPAIQRVQFTGVGGTRGITIFVLATPGTSTHAIAGVGAEAYGIYTSARGQAVSASGTITVTLDTMHKIVFGTFSFEADSFSPLLGHVSVTDGSFFVSYE